MVDIYTNIHTETTENSEVIITGEITVEASADFRKKAMREITASLQVAGFRKGHVPEKVVIEKVGEAYILEETAEQGLKNIVPELIEKNAPTYVGRPQIEITKLAPGNPIGFKITVAILPTITLPDYKKIAVTEMNKKDEVAVVTEKEIDEVVESVRKQHAHRTFHTASPDADHSHSEEEVAKHLPEWNDEFVKSLGAFESVADFRTKAKENMLKEKQHRNIEKKRAQLLEALIEKTPLKLPTAIISSELERMYAQFEADITGMGLKVDDYLKHLKKTREDLTKDWTPDAEKRAKVNLILAEIAKVENIVPDKDALEAETKLLLERFKDADQNRVAAYVMHTLTIEGVIKFLEGQSKAV